VSIATKALGTAIGSLLSCTEEADGRRSKTNPNESQESASGKVAGTETRPARSRLRATGVQMKRSNERLDVVETKGSERHERYFLLLTYIREKLNIHIGVEGPSGNSSGYFGVFGDGGVETTRDSCRPGRTAVSSSLFGVP
jgi:hypothetical protein